MLVRGIVGSRVALGHQMMIERRTPRVFRMLQRERVELASGTGKLAREQFEVQKRERAAKVEQERFQFCFFSSSS